MYAPVDANNFYVSCERVFRPSLKGIPVVVLSHNDACIRSFGRAITELHQLTEAVTEFASRAAQKARKQGSAAFQVLAFIHTSPLRTPGHTTCVAYMPAVRA